MKLKKHRYNIRIKNISNKQAKRNRELAKIKSDLEPICYICGRWGANDLAHLLPKSTYPEHYTNERNLVLLCRDCHKKYDDNLAFRKEQKHIYERIASFDKQSADRYFDV